MGKNNESKLITISNFGFIHTLGIHGPIVAPVSVSVPLIVKTIAAGYSVSEVVDEVSTPLTLDDFAKKEKEKEVPQAPVAPATTAETETNATEETPATTDGETQADAQANEDASTEEKSETATETPATDAAPAETAAAAPKAKNEKNDKKNK